MENKKVCVMASLGNELAGFSVTGVLFELLGDPVKVGDIVEVPGPLGDPETAMVTQIGSMDACDTSRLMKARPL